uniref:Glucuronosyltransferase n=1 Tax=Clastoptera arizonana TaxID=38151 RepID=A0A1B6C0W4_9HEMI
MMINLLFELFTYLDNLVLEQLLQKLNNHKFDLVMTEIFNTDLFLGFAYKYKANIISLSSCPVVPWGTQRFGIPDNPAYIPYAFSSKIDLTSFTNRLWNFYSNFILKTVYEQYYLNKISNTAKKYFGSDMTSLEELTKKTSLLLVNSHPSLKEARPLPPQVIEIGGLHVKPAKPLLKVSSSNSYMIQKQKYIFSYGNDLFVGLQKYKFLRGVTYNHDL